MKNAAKPKIIITAVVILAIVIVIPLIFIFQIDSIVKSAIETVGPEATKTTVTVEKVSVSPFSLDAQLNGLVIGNPPDYKSPFAMKLNHIQVDVDGDTANGKAIKIEKINIDGAEVNWDGIKGGNLMKIKENVLDFAGLNKDNPSPEPKDSDSENRFYVKEFAFTNAKMHVWIKGKNVITLDVPDVRLHDIGDPVDGSTMGEIIADIYPKLLSNLAQLVSKNYNNIATAAGDLWDEGKNFLEKGVDRIQRIFK